MESDYNGIEHSDNELNKLKLRKYVYQMFEENLINENYLQEILNKIDSINEADLMKEITDKDLTNYNNVKNFFLNIRKKQPDEVRDLNDYFYVIIGENEISFHLKITDLKPFINRQGLSLLENEFEDAMTSLAQIVKEKENINGISAISHLVRKGFIGSLFEQYGFKVYSKKVEDAKNDEFLQKFYDKFKNYNGKNYTQLGIAYISREDFLDLMSQNKL